MRFWRKRKLVDDLKTVTEIAGDQVAPGMGTLALVIGGLAVGAAGAYVLHKRHQNKKAAQKDGLSENSVPKPDQRGSKPSRWRRFLWSLR